MYKRVTLVVKPGQIIFADAKVECTIRTMSRFGASIEASSRANIPDQFVLLVSSVPGRCGQTLGLLPRLLKGIRDGPASRHFTLSTRITGLPFFSLIVLVLKKNPRRTE